MNDAEPMPNTPPSKQQDLAAYIQSMTDKERKAYHIAESHLGSSFSLEKSLGFIEWKMKQKPASG